MNPPPHFWAELLAELRRLEPTPLQALAPLVTGILGLIGGFLLSIWKDSLDRKRQQREAAAQRAAEARANAVKSLIEKSRQWVQQFSNAGREWESGDKVVSDLFLSTGIENDDIIQGPALDFIERVKIAVRSYELRDGEGNVVKNASGLPEIPRYNADVVDAFQRPLNVLQGQGQLWVDGARPAEFLIDAIRAAAFVIDNLADVVPDRTP